jgi:hypothetical protein
MGTKGKRLEKITGVTDRDRDSDDITDRESINNVSRFNEEEAMGEQHTPGQVGLCSPAPQALS